MRFGTFTFSVSHDHKRDHDVIDNSMREVLLAEEIGMHAVWLTEHHFDGGVAYADPVVFGAAVAVRTKKLRIGFAVVEMAMHHPVRLAVQTALLDHLSHGRLTVGIGRGSAYNEYEYIGFGLPMEDARDMLPEAEELLVKAWRGEDVRHEGRFWKSSFPMLRPQPYQKPHPPIVRACISDGSAMEMASIGRPILIGIESVDTLRDRLRRYGETMLKSGFTEDQTEAALDETWCQRALYVTETDEEAEEPARLHLKRYRDFIMEARVKYNPGSNLAPDPKSPVNPDNAPVSARDQYEHAFLAGSPKRVSEQLAELRDAGVRNLMLNVNVGEMPQDKVEASMKLFGEKVLPKFT